jgi:hypothetical protein
MNSDTRWTLNTPEPVAANKLAASLRAIVDDEQKLAEARHTIEVAEKRAAPATPEELALALRIHAQRDAAIEAAGIIAAAGDAERVTASLSGHVDVDHSDGIEERVAVYVDSAP